MSVISDICAANANAAYPVYSRRLRCCCYACKSVADMYILCIDECSIHFLHWEMLLYDKLR